MDKIARHKKYILNIKTHVQNKRLKKDTANRQET